MPSKYYELYTSGDINESILDTRLGQCSFEEHYWFFACLTKYYEQTKNSADEKAVLTKMCDMNYVFNALTLYNQYGVLPNNYKQYITPFENSMLDQRIEERIKYYNKQEKKKGNKRIWISSFASLVSIPLMIFLMVVCKLEATPSIVITIVALMIIQLFTNPMMDNSFLKKTFKKIFPTKAKEQYSTPAKLVEYFKYLDRFVRIVNNELYLALARANEEKDIEEIVKTIKEKKPIV